MKIESQTALFDWLLAYCLALAAAGKYHREAIAAARYLARKLERGGRK